MDNKLETYAELQKTTNKLSKTIDENTICALELVEEATGSTLERADDFIKNGVRNISQGVGGFSEKEFSSQRSYWLGTLFSECRFLYQIVRELYLENRQLNQQKRKLQKQVNRLELQPYN